MMPSQVVEPNGDIEMIGPQQTIADVERLNEMLLRFGRSPEIIENSSKIIECPAERLARRSCRCLDGYGAPQQLLGHVQSALFCKDNARSSVTWPKLSRVIATSRCSRPQACSAIANARL